MLISVKALSNFVDVVDGGVVGGVVGSVPNGEVGLDAVLLQSNIERKYS